MHSRKNIIHVEDTYEGSRCLVTGHTGFKGAWMAQWLSELGAEVAGFALDPETSPNLFEKSGVAETIIDVRGDIRDYQKLSETIDGFRPEYVFHLAAQPIVRLSYTIPRETFDVNCMGTVNVLEALRDADAIKAIIVITSDKCYENTGAGISFGENDRLGGHDPYSASKAAAEIVCSSYRRAFFDDSGVLLVTARAGNVIGGGDWAEDRIIPDAVRAVESGEELVIRNPGAVRPWQHVLEPLFGYLLLGSAAGQPWDLEDEPAASRNAWNFGPEDSGCRTVEELAGSFYRHYGRGDYRIDDGGGETKLHEASVLKLNWEKAKKNLGWSPLWDFEESIRRTGEWYCGFYEGKNAGELCLNEIRDYMDHDD